MTDSRKGSEKKRNKEKKTYRKARGPAYVIISHFE